MCAHRQTRRVLLYGVLGVDQILQVSRFPEPDGHARILSEGEFVGGEAANAAVFLSRLGTPVRLMGCTLGEDRLGSLFLREIKRCPGLDVSGLDVESGLQTVHALVLSEPGGRRGVMGSFPDLRSRPLRPEDLEGFSVVSVDPFLGRNAVEAARLARDAGLPVFSIELSEAHPMAELCQVVINSDGFISRHSLGSEADVAVGLLKAGVETVVVTRGPDGCTVYRENGSSFHQPAYPVDVQDSTGAGDAFRAGLIYGYLQGWTLTRSVQFASGMGALACCSQGGSGQAVGEEAVLRLISSG